MKNVSAGNKQISVMTVGTVQLGMHYGIANFGGKPDREKSFSMLRCALENGVNSLDTARVYGDAEEVIGAFFKTWEGELPFITTKIPFSQVSDAAAFEKYAIRSVEESLTRLGVKKVDAVMLHSVQDMYRFEEKAAKTMEKLIKMGYTDQVGVSVYEKSDVENMLRYPQYSVTQIPMSIFDQRLIASQTNAKLKEAGYTVFVRSVFLQGLFFLDPDGITDPILIEHAKEKIGLLGEIAKAEGMSVAQLAIAFMRDTLGVTSLVLGADTPEQVKENIAYFDAPSLSSRVVSRLQREFSNVNIPEIMKVLARPKS